MPGDDHVKRLPQRRSRRRQPDCLFFSLLGFVIVVFLHLWLASLSRIRFHRDLRKRILESIHFRV
jgi:hypothetical protein